MKETLTESVMRMSPKALVENYKLHSQSTKLGDKKLTEEIIKELEYRNLLESIYRHDAKLLGEIKNYSEGELVLNFLQLAESKSVLDYVKRAALKEELTVRKLIPSSSLNESLTESEENDSLNLFCHYLYSSNVNTNTLNLLESVRGTSKDTDDIRKIRKVLKAKTSKGA